MHKNSTTFQSTGATFTIKSYISLLLIVLYLIN